MNLKKWKPTKQDYIYFENELKQEIEFYLTEIEDLEEAKETEALLKEFKESPVKRKKEIIQEKVKSEFYIFDPGTVKEYLGEDRGGFIERVLGITN